MNSKFISLFDYSKPLSLYIHIPFCSKKCDYCAFYSCSGISNEVKESYTAKLVREINAVTSQMTVPFYTAFIGGGNPGCLSAGQLERICKAVCRNGKPKEFTTEMNPESLSLGMMGLFGSYITRLSLGVQSFSEKALEFLGRNASLEDTKRGLDFACKIRKEKNIQINCDLITCLGSFHNALKDARTLIENYNPDHISLYALTIEEGTKFHSENKTIPNSDEQYKILKEVWEYLKAEGYVHYEVSNFAKKDKKSLHNSAYWSYGQYMGLGSGAASTACSDGRYTRIDGLKNLIEYANSELFSTYSYEELSKNEALEELVFMGLRHSEGLNLKRMEKEFGHCLPFIPEHYSIKSGFLVPEEEGLMLCDAVAVILLSRFG